MIRMRGRGKESERERDKTRKKVRKIELVKESKDNKI